MRYTTSVPPKRAEFTTTGSQRGVTFNLRWNLLKWLEIVRVDRTSPASDDQRDRLQSSAIKISQERDALRDGYTVTGLEGSHQEIAERYQKYLAYFVCRRQSSSYYRVTVSYKICATGRQIVCVIPVVDIQVDRGEHKGCTLQVESLTRPATWGSAQFH